MALQAALAVVSAFALSTSAQHIPSGGVSSFVAPSGFPTSVFSTYWTPPSPTQEPQPAIFDPVLNSKLPISETDQPNMTSHFPLQFDQPKDDTNE